jgi:hypothetical protein
MSVEAKFQSPVNPCTTSWSVTVTITGNQYPGPQPPWHTPGSC